MASAVELYRAQLSASIQPLTWLAIADMSDGHVVQRAKDGRALNAQGRDIVLLVVTEVFDGRTPLERQRIVNDVRQAQPEPTHLKPHDLELHPSGLPLRCACC